MLKLAHVLANITLVSPLVVQRKYPFNFVRHVVFKAARKLLASRFSDHQGKLFSLQIKASKVNLNLNCGFLFLRPGGPALMG